MAYQFIQVETLSCDNCGKTANLVKNQPEQSIYGEWSEWDMFKENLAKDGWLFTKAKAENPGEDFDEEIFCSMKCRDSKTK